MHVFCISERNVTCLNPTNTVSFWVLIDLCCCSAQACRRKLIQSDLSAIQSILCASADYKKGRSCVYVLLLATIRGACYTFKVQPLLRTIFKHNVMLSSGRKCLKVVRKRRVLILNFKEYTLLPAKSFLLMRNSYCILLFLVRTKKHT